MIKKFLSAGVVFLVTLAFISELKADYIVDFVNGVHPKVTKTFDISLWNTTSNPNTGVAFNASDIVFTAESQGGGVVPTASVRYTFDTGLFDYLGGFTSSSPLSLVRFEVAMNAVIGDVGNGNFNVVGTYGETGGNVETFSTINFNNDANPSTGSARQVMFTERTMTDLSNTDIEWVEWNVTYSGNATVAQNPNVFTFGNNSGLIAAPEPTSAAMIGCALVGLVARRRRKS